MVDYSSLTRTFEIKVFRIDTLDLNVIQAIYNNVVFWEMDSYNKFYDNEALRRTEILVQHPERDLNVSCVYYLDQEGEQYFIKACDRMEDVPEGRYLSQNWLLNKYLKESNPLKFATRIF